MYLVLLCFFMFPSCYAKISLGNERNKMLVFFERKCLENHTGFSNIWKYIFFSMRYIQAMMLAFLFIRGFSTSINNLQNLGYMIFFVIYTAYESIYRRSSKLLCLFTAAFIVMQYYGSLSWRLYQDYVTGDFDPEIFPLATWANIIPFANEDKSDPYEQRAQKLSYLCTKARSNNQMYCEYSPVYIDWVILLFMGFL